MEEPTIEEVLSRARTIGLSEVEAHKFFFYYGANGWMVGRTKMKNWHMALSGWKLRWQQCQEHVPSLSNTDKILFSKELDRIELRMRAIEGSYGGHQELDFKDRAEIKTLRTRKAELLKILGMMI